ncbi:MAG: hypothetical protein VCC00_14820 [Deltaproteobacteria bacterium]
MSSIWARRSLWFSLLLVVPVPFWAFQVGWVPIAWLAEITGVTLIVLAQDGGLVPTTLSGVLIPQLIVWAALLFFASGRIVHALPAGRRAQCVGLIGLTLITLGLLLPLYTTSFVRDGSAVTLVELFQ